MRKRYYSEPEVARMYMVSIQAVNKWLKMGQFPNARQDPDTRRWEIPEEDLINFIPPRFRKGIPNDLALEIKNANGTFTDIARRYGITPKFVKRIKELP